MRRIPRAAVWAIATIALIFAVFLTRVSWLTFLGAYLVDPQAPFQADVISVLGGDFRGDRLITAATLALQGYAPLVLVSGSGPIYGQKECDLAVRWAVEKGYPENMFAKVPTLALSTEDEAAEVIRVMRRLKVKKFLLVTSNYHTHRAERIFHRQAPDLVFHVVAAPDDYFSPGTWWRTREGQKIFVYEWGKTLASWVGE